jgi:hypothetical protein
MRRVASIVALALLLGVAPPRAAAQEKDYSSPRRFYVELKFGPYAPNIDSEFNNGKTPFRDLFGDGKALLFGGEFDVEVYQRFGTVAIGGVIGYYTNGAKTFIDTGNDTTPSSTATRTAFDTSLNLLPLSLLAIYRFDLLAIRWRIPVVPFVKVGLNYTFWWTTKGSGDASTFQGHKAAGGTFGWQINAGGALLLDVFEPHTARALDTEIGINHTYLYFEFTYFAADGLGKSSALHVGDTTWNGGLAFEF